MGFYLATLPVLPILKLAKHRVEGIVDGDTDVGMAVFGGHGPVGGKLPAMQRQMNAQIENLALVPASMRGVDDDATGRDVSGKALKPGGAPAHLVFDSRRGIEIVEGDLKGNDHRVHLPENGGKLRRRAGGKRGGFLQPFGMDLPQIRAAGDDELADFYGPSRVSLPGGNDFTGAAPPP